MVVRFLQCLVYKYVFIYVTHTDMRSNRIKVMCVLADWVIFLICANKPTVMRLTDRMTRHYYFGKLELRNIKKSQIDRFKSKNYT